MRDQDRSRNHNRHGHGIASRSFLLATGVPLLPFIVLTPAAIFFPLISASALALSAFIALTAWHCVPVYDGERVTLWDLSGACALIAFATAIFNDAEPLITWLTGY